MKKMISATMLLLSVSLIFSGCASGNKANSAAGSKIRFQAVQETALSFGAQSALAVRAERINQVVENHAENLDRIYPFFRMQLKSNVMPPVLALSINNLNVDSADVLRETDEKIEIIRPAFLAVTPPSWRDYIILSQIKNPELPSVFLLPKTHKEQLVWNHFLQKGWDQGTKQADALFQQGLARLSRDFEGMLIYHALLNKNMVTPPYVSSAHLGITGNENMMRINDKIVRITAHSKLLPEQSNNWNAIIIKND